MKKMFICLVGMVMAISLAGCGGQSDAQNGGSAPDSSYTSAVQVLETVIDTYTEEQKFPIGGGDSENLTSEVPGAFDISKTEELALKNAVHQRLKRMKHIKSYRLGTFGEGETGVTIVEFQN